MRVTAQNHMITFAMACSELASLLEDGGKMGYGLLPDTHKPCEIRTLKFNNENLNDSLQKLEEILRGLSPQHVTSLSQSPKTLVKVKETIHRMYGITEILASEANVTGLLSVLLQKQEQLTQIKG